MPKTFINRGGDTASSAEGGGYKEMPILLFRHAQAHNVGEEGIENDDGRFLTPKGKKTTYEACQGLMNLGIHGDEIWFSPKKRARETAEIIAGYMGIHELREKHALAVPEDPKVLEDLLNDILEVPRKRELILVGHQPHLGRLINQLTSSKNETVFSLSKSGVARVDLFDSNGQPKGKLVWLLRAKHLRLIAK